MQDTAFQIEVPFKWIQSLRLVHALLESDYDVRIPARHHHKLRRLEAVFDVSFGGAVEGVPVLPGLRVCHEGLPETQIGSIQRPLIFARGMVDHCRELWQEDRSVRVCFAGRLHFERRQLLRRWLREQYPDERVRIPDQSVVDDRVELRRKVRSWGERLLKGPLRPLQKYVGVPPVEEREECGDVLLVTSDRGWSFPTKAWDSRYFDLLSRSKFVLCPDGQFVWTYRFFEAALCGSIPIIQNKCPLYEGFQYYTMDDPVDKMKWREGYAYKNAQLCRKRLTVSSERLNGEIETLLSEAEVKS